MLNEGDLVSGYRIERLLDQSDLGPRYLISRDGHTSVLRILEHPDPTFQERLRRAGQAQKGADHPHIVSVHEVIETEQGPGLVTEFVQGGDLADWIAAGPHPLAETVEVFAGLMRGLAGFHEAGILHRNLKPSKVLLTEQGTAKVNDFVFGRFDVSDGPRLTGALTTFGTPQFMAPEQFHSAAEVDERADLFSAGCVLYEMLTATRAFPGTQLMDIYTAISSADCVPIEAARPGLPRPLVELVQALMATDPEDRPGSARQVLQRIEALAPLLTSPQPPTPSRSASSTPAHTPHPAVARTPHSAVSRTPRTPAHTPRGAVSRTPRGAPAHTPRSAARVQASPRPEALQGRSDPPELTQDQLVVLGCVVFVGAMALAALCAGLITLNSLP